MQTHIFPTAEELNYALAEWIADLISSTLQVEHRFTICLSGGSTPKSLYQLLGSHYKDKVNWQRVHFFWGDERHVPFTDKQNNAAMAYESLLNKIQISDEQVNVIRTDLPVAESIKRYVRLLDLYFHTNPKTFDLVLLGMGDDGHTLSLFPGYKEKDKPEQWVIDVVKDGNTRISLTPALVNRASAIVFLVSGENKAQTLREVMYGSYDPVKYPSQLIKPANNNLHWFLDEPAAKCLQS